MKDAQSCQHQLSDDVVYKEVVVIGNGPSGLVTSFMLAGNVPHLKKVPEDLPIDDMLRARLSNVPEGQNLYEADLIALAEGLEGRSQNPIPLLMDNLFRPCADLGVQADPLIEWKYDVEKQIEHVVLGRGAPGGSWGTFPRAVRTLSPAAWLALPPHAAGGGQRLSARAVARYCRRYVRDCDLQRYFRCNVVVTSVTRAPACGETCAAGCPLRARYLVSGYDKSAGMGFRYLCARVVLACGGGDRPNVLPPPTARHALHSLAALERALQPLPPSAPPVLVVGSGVSAADAVWVCVRGARRVAHLHRTPAEALARLQPHAYPDYCQVYKMMCDGPSGNHENYTPLPHHVIVDVTPRPAPRDHHTYKLVTLLDLHTNETSQLLVSAIGVFIGSKPDLFFLQTNFDLNCIDLKTCKCIENKKIEEKRFFKNHWMYFKNVLQTIQNCKSKYFSDGECKCDIIPYSEEKCQCQRDLSNEIDCQCRRDDLSNGIKCQCQREELSNGIGFGVDESKPVDSRNPIAIDKGTHEVLNAPKGLYALGPLTGDNFVRFIPGGALAIVAHMHRDRQTHLP